MKNIIPIFFAADDNYLPYLAVALRSVKENASENYKYKIYILHSGVSEVYAEKITAMQNENFSIEFTDVSEKLTEISSRLHMRDYYTGTTYYRIFIADMFPEYDKALYLDSDTVILGDISELFNHDVGENLIGAITDETVLSVPIFKSYVKDVLGIKPKNYFNAGIILMNLKKFREENFYEKFADLLQKYKFTVAQDQDYLNVLCAGKVTYISPEWNKMPIPGENDPAPKLIHYNLTRKPWHYKKVLYQEFFWKYAKQTDFYGEIENALASFTEEDAKRDAECEKNLLRIAESEINSAVNYSRLFAVK